jgi:hypothetical protein
MLKPIVGLKLDGAVVGVEGEAGRVGEPVWGPMGLLADLEVRVGLRVSEGAEAQRVQRWARRMGALVEQATGAEPFYARSFAVDPLGTAAMVLAWRDGLIEAGWAGTAVAGGGARLATMAELEALREPAMIAGAADRLAAVETEVALLERAPYAELRFADDQTMWAYRWQRIFALLAERGAMVRGVAPSLGGAETSVGDVDGWRAGSTDSDLGQLQALIVGGGTSRKGTRSCGDGSLVVVRAATTAEAADGVAAMLTRAGESVAVVRPAEALALDEAIAAHGGRRLGAKPASRWRAATLALPLALEMLFDPCDPRSVLELVSLPVSPFRRVTRWELTSALCDAPGVGDGRWRHAKERVRARMAAWAEAARDEGDPDALLAVSDPGDARVEDERRRDAEGRAARELETIEAWLEPDRFDARVGAPAAAIVATVTRVREWLRRRLPAGEPIDAVAFNQCETTLAMIAEDGRAGWTWLALRQLLDAVGDSGAVTEASREEAGRADHVEHPGALLAARDVVIWWHFVGSTARPPHRARWRRPELDALAACGVVPLDPARVLAEESRHWRSAVLAARRRLVLVVPDTDRGERCAPHPLWDEIVARLALDDELIERVTVRIADLLHGGNTAASTLGLEVEKLESLPLPAARAGWTVAPGLIGAAVRWTPGGLQALLECPLRWTLDQAAGIRGRSVPALPKGPMLNGALAHRLVAELITSGGLTRDRGAIVRAIDALLPGIAARLRLPGMAVELEQLRHQLVRMVGALADLVADGGLRVAGVEEEVEATWLGGELRGRLDVRLQDAVGHDIVLDLKWGHGAYRDVLAHGRAVQLAFYSEARRQMTSALRPPAAAYFSLGKARLLATAPDAFGATDRVRAVDGPDIAELIERIARTVPRVQAALADGAIAVTGVASSAPLLDVLQIGTDERGLHYTPPGLPRRAGRAEPLGCKYCRMGAVCGRAWESAE